MANEKSTDMAALAKLIQDAIDKGARTIEEIHKSIADLPLSMFEGSQLLREPAKKMVRVQDHTIGAIYDLIRDINRRVGTLASELLTDAANATRAKGRASAKHHGAPGTAPQ
jgi:hypothetical protein